MEELSRTAKKLKRRKACGPDEIPVEFLKEMSRENLQPILDLLNEWWTNASIPEETMKARVVLIFKKGDK